MRDDNALLRAADDYIRYTQDAVSAIQIGAAIVVLAVILLACYLVLHLGPVMS